MGIFKDNKPKTLKPAKKAKPKDKIRVDKNEDTTVISGNLPEGFDPTDEAAVKQLMLSKLKEAGILPKGVDLNKVEMKTVEFEMGGDEVDMGKPEAMADLIKRFHKMEPAKVPDVPLPQDQPKAAFVAALNCLHKQVHALAPMAADLMQSVDCLRMILKAGNPGAHEKRGFAGFEAAVADVMKTMAKFGEATCELTIRVAAKGIPAPDSSSSTIN